MSDIVEAAPSAPAIQAFDYMVKIVTSGVYNHWRHLGMDDEPAMPRADGKAFNSDGVKESWAQPSIAAARMVRQKVHVALPDGQVIEYASLKEAFLALRLPIEKHIRFRLKLKGCGELPYVHNDKTYLFKIGDVRTDSPPRAT